MPKVNVNVIEVPSAEVAAVAKWTSRDETRMHLHMVLFTDDEYVATDGNRLVRVPCATHGLRIGVDRDHLLSAVAAQREGAPKKRSNVILLEPYGATAKDAWKRQIRITIGEGVYVVVPGRDTGRYPPYNQVMPKGRPGGAPPSKYAFNAQYFADVAEVIRGGDVAVDIGEPGWGRDHGGVDITGWGDELDPVELTSGRGARFVIMPMRGPLAPSTEDSKPGKEGSR